MYLCQVHFRGAEAAVKRFVSPTPTEVGPVAPLQKLDRAARGPRRPLALMRRTRAEMADAARTRTAGQAEKISRSATRNRRATRRRGTHRAVGTGASRGGRAGARGT